MGGRSQDKAIEQPINGESTSETIVVPIFDTASPASTVSPFPEDIVNNRPRNCCENI